MITDKNDSSKYFLLLFLTFFSCLGRDEYIDRLPNGRGKPTCPRCAEVARVKGRKPETYTETAQVCCFHFIEPCAT